jgi:hypothetical protein
MKRLQSVSYSLGVCLSLSLLSGCASHQAQTTGANEPQFRIQQYYNGNLHAHGIVLNKSGDLTRTFAIDMKGSWKDQRGVLKELIHYNDGKTQTREWHFVFEDAHHFTASAADAVGLAKGTQYGNTVHMAYTLNVPVDDKTYAINFDDWLYMTIGGKVINKTTLSKYGFHLGEVIITYDKK